MLHQKYLLSTRCVCIYVFSYLCVFFFIRLVISSSYETRHEITPVFGATVETQKV